MRAQILMLSAILTGCGGDAGSTTPAGGTTSAGGEAAAPAPSSAPSDIDVAELKARMEGGDIVLIDVRQPSEYAAGHVPGARLIPLGELSGRLEELSGDKAGPVHLICKSGGRSARAQRTLVAAGFAEPINVRGGTGAWIKAGYPVE